MSVFKKLAALLAVALMGASLTVAPQPRIEVQAAPTSFTWTSVNLFSTFYRLESTNIPIGGSRFVDITFPYSTYHRFNITSIGNARMLFLNAALATTDTIDLVNLKSSAIGGSYSIDLDYQGISTTAIYIKLEIPQSYSSTPANYVTFMNADSTYDPFPSYLLTARFWSRSDLTIDAWTLDYELAFVDIPVNPGSPTTNPSLTDYYFLGWYLDGYRYNFNMGLSSYSGIVNFYSEYAPWVEVIFMNGMTQFDDSDFIYAIGQEFYPLPPVSNPTRSGYTFTGWKTRDQEFYNFDRLPTISEFNPSNDTAFYLYASFVVNAPSGTAYSPNTPAAITALATILNNFGMYNYPALMFLFFVMLIALNGVLAWFVKPPAFVYMVVSLVLAVFFMFMNLIPLYIMIPLIAFFVYGLIHTLQSGGLSNE